MCDGEESIEAIGRPDDGSDESIVSSKLAEKAVLNGIGKMSKIPLVKLQVALKEGEEAKEFSFSRSWTTPRTILQLSSGPLALVNVTYLVADAQLAVEDLLIGLPILKHLGIDTKTLLEERRDLLDGADCSTIRAASSGLHGGQVSRLMVARLNRTTNDAVEPVMEIFENRTRVDYYRVKEEVDPFPDPSLLDPVDSDQSEDVETAVSKRLQDAFDNGFPEEKQQELTTIVKDRINVFRVSLSAGPPVNVPPLKIDLVADAKPVRVRLRNYSQDQRLFLAQTLQKLIDCGMVYSNPTSPWACAPLLVPKSGPSKYRFTIDLRPVNRYTVRHQFPMPNLEQDLLMTSGSKFFGSFDFSNGYWQFPLHPDSQASQSFITPDGIYSQT